MAKSNIRSSDMQYISSAATGFSVKFFGKRSSDGARPLEAYKTFRISDYGSTANARYAAKAWRDEQKSKLRKHPSAITANVLENADGFVLATWNVSMGGQQRQLSMRQFGYGGAYKRALTILEQISGQQLPFRPSPPAPTPEQLRILNSQNIQLGEVMSRPPQGIRLSVRKTTDGFVRAEWLVDERAADGSTKVRSVSIRKNGYEKAYNLAVQISEQSSGQPVIGIIPLPDDHQFALLSEIGIALAIEDKRRTLVM